MAEGRVLVDNDGALRVLTLSRPGRYNGMDTPMLEALATAVRDAARDPGVRCVLLTGADGAFSAGGDPAEMTGPHADAVVDRWTQISTEVTGWIFRAEKPVVCAVDGVAVGAGFALAIACDIVLVSKRSTLVPVFVRRGILPDHAALWFLPRLVGLRRAMELVLSGRAVDGDEAARIGLATEAMPDEGFAAAARSYAHRLASGPGCAQGYTKLVLHSGMDSNLWTVQAFERIAQPSLFASPDVAEGFAAYFERRDPRFGTSPEPEQRRAGP
ncbi:MAG: enoyl-CoA hydratase/isomerase family protein [Actinomycetota bacterium]|nr:enoyl-CoA hydratase/isomerase family protein [Actinomycetota bacterium]